jgi:uncharacterized phage protein (TIGR01671 family)
MREIKFRAFDDGAMIYSHTNLINDPYSQLGYFFNKICPEAIVMQFTGLLDKNGNEVYEGDILKFPTSLLDPCDLGAYELESVKYREGCYFLSNGEFLHNWNEDCEIIGNIYENPNLLP